MGKQDEATNAAKASISKRQLFALWSTVLTLLGTSVVPKIIDVVSDRPSVTEVQDMIAEQTTALTVSVNKLIDSIDALDTRLNTSDKVQSKMSGHVESLQSTVRDCCTRHVSDVGVRSNPRTTKPTSKKPTAAGHAEEKVTPEEDSAVSPPPVKQQQKLPPFNPVWIQQKAVKE